MNKLKKFLKKSIKGFYYKIYDMIKYGNILQNINRLYINMVVKIYSYLTTIKQYKILIDSIKIYKKV